VTRNRRTLIDVSAICREVCGVQITIARGGIRQSLGPDDELRVVGLVVKEHIASAFAQYVEVLYSTPAKRSRSCGHEPKNIPCVGEAAVTAVTLLW
jgi:hypothetical protein